MNGTSGARHKLGGPTFSATSSSCWLGPLSRTEFTSGLTSHLNDAAHTAQHGPPLLSKDRAHPSPRVLMR